MKISVPYVSVTGVPTEYENKITEMYTKYRGQLDAITKYNHHSGKYRMVFILDERENPKELEEIQEALEGNCAFVIPAITRRDIKSYMNVNSIYAFPCTSWHEVYSVASMGFNEIHISASMSMMSSKIKQASQETGLKIRVKANKAQTDSEFDDKSAKSFWIRPEAIDKYEGIVDTIELSRIEALPFYVKKRSPKNLDNLIENLPPFTANENYRNIHDNSRMNCGMGCKSGKDCNICQ